jgi:hypothetical protein
MAIKPDEPRRKPMQPLENPRGNAPPPRRGETLPELSRRTGIKLGTVKSMIQQGQQAAAKLAKHQELEGHAVLRRSPRRSLSVQTTRRHFNATTGRSGGLLENQLHVGFVEPAEVDQLPSLIAAHVEELFQSALVQLGKPAGEQVDEITPIWHLVLLA